MAKGWECPKCGSVYAPHISECKRCANSRMQHTISGTSGFVLDYPSTQTQTSKPFHEILDARGISIYPANTGDTTSLIQPGKISQTAGGA